MASNYGANAMTNKPATRAERAKVIMTQPGHDITVTGDNSLLITTKHHSEVYSAAKIAASILKVDRSVNPTGGDSFIVTFFST